MHWSPLQPDNLNDKVWRYMDLPKFFYLLDAKRLYLPSAERLGDKHEGSVFWFQKEIEQKVCVERGLMETIAITSEMRQAQPKCTFISCWHKNNYDSHAMWKIYCGPKQGVAIMTSYLNLSKFVNLGLYAMGCVTYDNPGPLPDNHFAPFMQKRKAFEYEQEVRIVANLYTSPDFRDENGKFRPSKQHLALPVDLEKLVEKIYIHPEADDLYFRVVKSLVSKHAPELNDRVEWSEMKAPPIY
jgi:hypothetical protein